MLYGTDCVQRSTRISKIEHHVLHERRALYATVRTIDIRTLPVNTEFRYIDKEVVQKQQEVMGEGSHEQRHIQICAADQNTQGAIAQHPLLLLVGGCGLFSLSCQGESAMLIMHG